MADLAPPTVHSEDAGAHDLENEHPAGKHPAGAISSEPSEKQDTPGGLPIPKTIVEKVEPENPSHGEVPGTAAYDIRTEDATPDEVRTAPDITRANLEDIPTSSYDRDRRDEAPQDDLDGTGSSASASASLDNNVEQEAKEEDHTTTSTRDEVETADDDGFDDFDDFAEGAEDDDAFGDFDEAANDTFESEIQEAVSEQPSIKTAPTFQSRIFDFEGLDSREDIQAALAPFIAEILPPAYAQHDSQDIDMSEVNLSFLTERSQSLWGQLVAPPPLQPPDWIRSRIRRLFLVSLGVPVDLDEILPASKQKKLVLPSTNLDQDRRGSVRTHEVAASGLVERMKGEDAVAAGSTPAEATPKPKPGSELDLNSARLLCSTTDVAIHNFTDAELQEHVARLTRLNRSAEQMLQYWDKQRDSAMGNKKAFEEVIENLVKHAQKIRK